MSVLSAKKLVKVFVSKQNQITVLDSIDFEFQSGEIIGLLGKNGAGKTTFIKSCLGLLNYSGNIYYKNVSLKEIKPSEKIKLFAATLEGQRNLFWKLSVIENIRFFTTLRGLNFKDIVPKVDYLLKILELYEKRNSLIENLSSGMRQKVSLVCALTIDPPIIFLDEPTLGVDVESKENLISFINSSDFFKDKVLVITSHDLSFIDAVSTRILLLKNGKLLEVNRLCNEETFELSVVNNEKLNIDLISNEIIYKNDRQIKFSVDNQTDLIKLIKEINKNDIKIISIENVQYKLDNFYK